MRKIIIYLIVSTSFLLFFNAYIKNPFNNKVIPYYVIAADLTTDTDGDGILDDGDNSGVLYDNPCTGGETADCDDNCLEFYNPEQIDVDSDGYGDLCECQADFEGDGDVDGANLSQILEHFGRNPYIKPCIPEDPCTGDFDNDNDVDADDITVILGEFGRNKWFLPCPPCFFGPVGPPPSPPVNPPDPRFIDHGDGTVTDNLTGLMWTKNAQQIFWKYHFDTVDIPTNYHYVHFKVPGRDEVYRSKIKPWSTSSRTISLTPKSLMMPLPSDQYIIEEDGTIHLAPGLIKKRVSYYLVKIAAQRTHAP